MAPPKARDEIGVVGQRAIADDRILWIGVNVEHGCIVERDANGAQFDRERCGKPGCEINAAAAAKHRHRRATR